MLQGGGRGQGVRAARKAQGPIRGRVHALVLMMSVSGRYWRGEQRISVEGRRSCESLVMLHGGRGLWTRDGHGQRR